MQISVSGTLTDDLFVLGQLHKTRIEMYGGVFECTRVAFNEAMSLAKYIHIDNHEESSIPEFIAHIGKMTDDEEDMN
ncbi:unnamed protein product [Rhizophagus irregularis]|nr:unnamed protein product [Rhizophagus irregularis]